MSFEMTYNISNLPTSNEIIEFARTDKTVIEFMAPLLKKSSEELISFFSTEANNRIQKLPNFSFLDLFVIVYYVSFIQREWSEWSTLEHFLIPNVILAKDGIGNTIVSPEYNTFMQWVLDNNMIMKAQNYDTEYIKKYQTVAVLKYDSMNSGNNKHVKSVYGTPKEIVRQNFLRTMYTTNTICSDYINILNKTVYQRLRSICAKAGAFITAKDKDIKSIPMSNLGLKIFKQTYASPVTTNAQLNERLTTLSAMLNQERAITTSQNYSYYPVSEESAVRAYDAFLYTLNLTPANKINIQTLRKFIGSKAFGRSEIQYVQSNNTIFDTINISGVQMHRQSFQQLNIRKPKGVVITSGCLLHGGFGIVRADPNLSITHNVYINLEDTKGLNIKLYGAEVILILYILSSVAIDTQHTGRMHAQHTALTQLNEATEANLLDHIATLPEDEITTFLAYTGLSGAIQRLLCITYTLSSIADVDANEVKSLLNKYISRLKELHENSY